MAFESIDVGALKSALNQCKNEIDYSKSKSIVSILSPSVWRTNSRNTLVSAINRLCDTRYKELSNKFDDCLVIAGKIEEYKKLQARNLDLENLIESLKPKLYYTEYYTDTYIDDDGEEVSERKSRRVLDYSVQNQIFLAEKEIKENIDQMTRLENEINSFN